MTSAITPHQAESPDEEALVEGAAELGFRLLKRSVTSCVIEVTGGAIPCHFSGAPLTLSTVLYVDLSTPLVPCKLS